jgi:hypothetical protein
MFLILLDLCGHGDLHELDPFVLEHLLFLFCGHTPDVPVLLDAVVHLQGLCGEFRPYVLGVLDDVLIDLADGPVEQFRPGLAIGRTALWPVAPLERNRRQDLLDLAAAADRTLEQSLFLLLLIGLPVLEPGLEGMSGLTLKIKGDHGQSHSCQGSGKLLLEKFTILW